MNFGEDHVGVMGKIGGKNPGMIGLIFQVDFSFGAGAKLVDDHFGLVARQQPFQEMGKQLQQLDISQDGLANAGLDRFDDDGLAGDGLRQMCLRIGERTAQAGSNDFCDCFELTSGTQSSSCLSSSVISRGRRSSRMAMIWPSLI